ncbi:MAG TPA: hypothetical protein VD816_02995, partial [Ohtaekwangia sp.]|nr:hypothetical protein [Ohtaekwangia sp.]
MRKTRRNIPDAFSPQNLPTSSPIINPSEESGKRHEDSITEEDIINDLKINKDQAGRRSDRDRDAARED